MILTAIRVKRALPNAMADSALQLADFIRRRMRERGTNIRKLAAAAKTTRQTLYNLLKPVTKHPGVPLLRQLEDALDLPRHSLVAIAYGKREAHLFATTSSKYPDDYSRFVGDITVPDKSPVIVNEIFEKIWEIANIGKVVWAGRRLRCDDAQFELVHKRSDTVISSGHLSLHPLQSETPIAVTLPGQSVRISVMFKAPRYPCHTLSYWKMVDGSGDLCFPNLLGVYCEVIVVTTALEKQMLLQKYPAPA